MQEHDTSLPPDETGHEEAGTETGESEIERRIARLEDIPDIVSGYAQRFIEISDTLEAAYGDPESDLQDAANRIIAAQEETARARREAVQAAIAAGLAPGSGFGDAINVTADYAHAQQMLNHVRNLVDTCAGRVNSAAEETDTAAGQAFAFLNGVQVEVGIAARESVPLAKTSTDEANAAMTQALATLPSVMSSSEDFYLAAAAVNAAAVTIGQAAGQLRTSAESLRVYAIHVQELIRNARDAQQRYRHRLRSRHGQDDGQPNGSEKPDPRQQGIEEALAALAMAANIQMQEPAEDEQPESTPATTTAAAAPSGDNQDDNDNTETGAATYGRRATEEEHERYRQRMEEIDRALAVGANPTSLDGYFDEGSTSYVFDLGDGRLLKMPRVENITVEDPAEPTGYVVVDSPIPDNYLDKQLLQPLHAGIGVDGLEQMVDYIPATSEHHGAVIVENVEGQPYGSMTADERAAIPPGHIDKLLDTCDEMYRRGLMPDYTMENIIYTPDGFVLIDYTTDTPYEEGDEHRPASSGADIADAFAGTKALFSEWAPGDPMPDHAQAFIDRFRHRYGDAATETMKERLARELKEDTVGRGDAHTFRFPE